MCNLIRLDKGEAAAARFGFQPFRDVSLAPRAAIRPTDPVLTVVQSEGARIGRLMRWGFRPAWLTPSKGAGPLTNARDDHLLDGRLWQSALSTSRCLVVADGYYEWLAKRPGERYARPIRYTLADGALFALAGLFTWHPELGESCAIVTTRPNELAARAHHRMPVMLPRDLEAVWLDPGVSEAELLACLQPYAAAAMRAHEVTPFVGDGGGEVVGSLAAATRPLTSSVAPGAGREPVTTRPAGPPGSAPGQPARGPRT
jgi:putative SOS response-associated peptidase YedK